MTDLTKLAAQIEASADFIATGVCEKHDAEPIREAASILRAAAGVDVQLNVVAYRDSGTKRCSVTAPAYWMRPEPMVYLSEATEALIQKDVKIAALESALRLALAAREDDVFAALDLSPDTFRTEGGAVNVGKLRAAIWHPADYLPADHWLVAAREGFVLVPVKPTPGMLFAGDDVNAECQAEGVSPVNAIYHAMITSAPATAAPKGTL